MNHEQHAFIKLAEEAGEIAKEALKIAQFGLDSVSPVDNISNRDKLRDELNDLFGTLRLVEQTSGFVFVPNEEKVAAKVEKVVKYRDISERLNLVN